MDGRGGTYQNADDIFANLNKEQAEAVRHTDGPLLILAGAGSGKTRVLVHRIAYLIREAGVSPWSVLGITFTNKAAREMKTRIETLLPDESAVIWISTFHSACVRMLRRDIERIGMSRDFTILDYDDQVLLIKECIKEMNLSDKQFTPKGVLEHIGRAKDEMLSPDGYAQLSGNDYYRARVAKIYALYQKKLTKNNSLDFDDIILLTIKLLKECGDILAYYQNRFAYVLVDEYQDTNTAQYVFISLLCAKWKNLCVVGDDDQSIYGWRGANIGNILGFEKEYPEAKIIKLEQNYRSTKVILAAANGVIMKNRKRKAKRLWTQNDEGQPVGVVELENEHEEAAYVARTIKKLSRAQGAGYDDFAVLYRINAQSRAVENMLVREGVPYKIIGGFKFFDRKEIKDLIAYLRLVQNPSDNISFKRVINVPRRGVGAATIDKLESLALSRDISIFEAAALAAGNIKSFPELKSAAVKLQWFIELIGGLAEYSKNAGVIAVLDAVLERSGIASMYSAERSEEDRARLENILEFKTEIIEFEKSFISDDIYYNEAPGGWGWDGDGEGEGDGNGGRSGGGNAGGAGGAAQTAGGISYAAGGAAQMAGGAVQMASGAAHTAGSPTGLSEFLTHVSLISDIDNFDETDEKVSLMTMHSAKGLEFDTVFIVGAEEGIFPGQRSMMDSALLEEERRLCYVAITRARRRLYFTNAESRTLFGNTTYNLMSRFVSDIPEDLVRYESRTNYGGAGGGDNEDADGGRGAGNNVDSIEDFLKRANKNQKPAPGVTRQTIVNQKPGQAPAAGFNGGDGDPSATRPPQAVSNDGFVNGREYEVGDAVTHKKYGRGTVANRFRDKGDYILEIMFNKAGIRRFIESMVNLRLEDK